MNTQLHPVPFHQDTIFVVDHLGQPFVPLRPLAENMGLDWKSQHAKVMARPERFSVVMVTTQMPGDDQRREVVCIPLKKINAWLYSISPDKVAPHLKEKIELYQEECDEVLFNYWFNGVGLPDRQMAGKMMVNTHEYVGLLAENNNLLKQMLTALKKEANNRKNFTPDEDARVMHLRGLGYSNRQIGEEIGRKTSSVRSCLRRLRDKGLPVKKGGMDGQMELFPVGVTQGR